MKDSTQNRAVRLITSTLLGSTLSDRELDEIANEFLVGGDSFRQVGKTLKEFLASNKSPVSASKTAMAEDVAKLTGDPVIDETLAIIKRRRLSKTNVMQRIASIDPGLANHFATRMSLSVEEILKELPKTSASTLLGLLRGRSSKEDEYLSGIMREKH